MLSYKNILIQIAHKAGVLARISPPQLRKMLFLVWNKISVFLPSKIYIIFSMCAYEFFETMMLFYKSDMVIKKKMRRGGILILNLNEKTQRIIYVARAYEEPITNFILKNIRRGDVCVDVGANIGYFTVLCAGVVGESGSVYAFEPLKSNFIALQTNILVNKLKNVKLLHKALGSTNGKVALHINPLNHGGNRILPFSFYKTGDLKYSVEEIKKLFSKDELQQEVKQATFDDVMRKEPKHISFVKIDVEGYEYEVLSGMISMLKDQRIDSIICEVSNEETKTKVYELLENHGFKPHTLSFKGEVISTQTQRLGDILFIRH